MICTRTGCRLQLSFVSTKDGASGLVQIACWRVCFWQSRAQVSPARKDGINALSLEPHLTSLAQSAAKQPTKAHADARMMADIVIGHLQHLTAGLQEQPPIATNAKLDALADRQPFHRQPFLFEGNWGHTHTACVLEQDLPALVDRVQASWPGLECQYYHSKLIFSTQNITICLVLQLPRFPGCACDSVALASES